VKQTEAKPLSERLREMREAKHGKVKVSAPKPKKEKKKS
jgi:hypothetical protein